MRERKKACGTDRWTEKEIEGVRGRQRKRDREDGGNVSYFPRSN